MTSGIFEIDDDFQKDVGPSSDDDEISEEVRLSRFLYNSRLFHSFVTHSSFYNCYFECSEAGSIQRMLFVCNMTIVISQCEINYVTFPLSVTAVAQYVIDYL